MNKVYIENMKNTTIFEVINYLKKKYKKKCIKLTLV